MTLLGKRIQLPINPLVNPLEDSTELDTIYFTNTDKVRFQNGKLRKLKGWNRIFSANGQRILGAARNIYSFRDASGNPATIIGTSRSLYINLEDGNMYNITPLLLEEVDIPDSLSTEYNASVNVTVSTTINSPVVTLNVVQYLNSGEEIEISGVSGTINGIDGSLFNGTFAATVIDNQTIQIVVNGLATSTGDAVVNMTWATSYIYVTIPNNSCMFGDRFKLNDAVDLANIPAANINGEQIISNTVNNDTFVFQPAISVIADALELDAGGTDITIQYQVPEGNTDGSSGYGYGGGQYGSGVYGSPLPFTNQAANTAPRVWSMDKWTSSIGAEYIVLTCGDAVGSADGNGSNLYWWPIEDVYDSVLTAPTLITPTPAYGGAPMFVKWVYTSNNIVCTLGGASYPDGGAIPTTGFPNYFCSSDVGQLTDWAPSPSSYAFSTYIDHASALISQASTRDRDVIFTEDELYRIIFVDKPSIWFIEKLFTTDGIMACKARAEIEDAVIWMGKGDFFVFDGTTVDILPNNTIKRYVYDNLNEAQYQKCFTYANTLYNEVWFFYPAGDDNEPNNYAMYNYKEKTWAIGTLPRTAAEEPLNISPTPYMIESNIESFIEPESIQSYFYALASNSIVTENGQAGINIYLIAEVYFKEGDYIQISGAESVGGIPADDINGIRQIMNVSIVESTGYGSGLYGAGNYGESASYNLVTLNVTAGAAATSTAVGGGDNVTVGTSIIGLNIINPRIDANEKITIINAPSVGGIPQFAVNVVDANVRAIVGTVVQVDNALPSTIFADSDELILNTGSLSFRVAYTPSARFFMQEVGYNDYNPDYIYGSSLSPYAPMLSFAQTNMAQLGEGDELCVLYSVFPDTNQKGNLSLVVSGKLYAQSPLIYSTLNSGAFTITPQTTKVDVMLVARQRQYYIQSYELDGDFLIGRWFEEIRISTPR